MSANQSDKKLQGMPCVKCFMGVMREHTMERSGVTIDQCHKCGGIWFDPDELETILGDKAVQPFFISPAANVNDEYQCPRCKVGMHEFRYPGTAVEIDACEKCHGIWLDHKEWSQISKARGGK